MNSEILQERVACLNFHEIPLFHNDVNTKEFEWLLTHYKLKEFYDCLQDYNIVESEKKLLKDRQRNPTKVIDFCYIDGLLLLCLEGAEVYGLSQKEKRILAVAVMCHTLKKNDIEDINSQVKALRKNDRSDRSLSEEDLNLVCQIKTHFTKSDKAANTVYRAIIKDALVMYPYLFIHDFCKIKTEEYKNSVLSTNLYVEKVVLNLSANLTKTKWGVRKNFLLNFSNKRKDIARTLSNMLPVRYRVVCCLCVIE